MSQNNRIPPRSTPPSSTSASKPAAEGKALQPNQAMNLIPTGGFGAMLDQRVTRQDADQERNRDDQGDDSKEHGKEDSHSKPSKKSSKSVSKKSTRLTSNRERSSQPNPRSESNPEKVSSEMNPTESRLVADHLKNKEGTSTQQVEILSMGSVSSVSQNPVSPADGVPIRATGMENTLQQIEQFQAPERAGRLSPEQIRVITSNIAVYTKDSDQNLKEVLVRFRHDQVHGNLQARISQTESGRMEVQFDGDQDLLADLEAHQGELQESFLNAGIEASIKYL